MSAESVFGSAYPHDVGGESIDFPRLLMEDYGTLEATVRVNRRDLTKAMADECKVVGADRFVAMRETERQDVTPIDVDTYLQTYDGARKALTMSLRKSGKTEEQCKEIIGKLDVISASRLARILVGFLTPSAPDTKPPDKGALPNA